MAIEGLITGWLSRLRDKNILRQGSVMLELGPQDLWSSRELVTYYGLKHLPASDVQRLTDLMYDKDGRVTPGASQHFYALFGATEVASIDFKDPRATYRIDLNEYAPPPMTADVVMNFGTAEHVFNVGNVFKFTHDALKTGGVSLCILPALGNSGHGFYNVHPTLYVDLAQANGYVIEDFIYAENWVLQQRLAAENKNGAYGLNYDALAFDENSSPPRSSVTNDRDLYARVRLDRFVRHCLSKNSAVRLRDYTPYVEDYCLVAMRKTRADAFVTPIQGLYDDRRVEERANAPATEVTDYVAMADGASGDAFAAAKRGAMTIVSASWRRTKPLRRMIREFAGKR